MWIVRYIKSMGDNFGMVTPKLYRSAQPSRSKLFRYREDYDIQVVLNLRHDAGEKEREDVAAVNLVFDHIPMLDNAAPTYEEVRDALDVMRCGLTVLVQCMGGRHRTGLMVAVYRVVEQGWSKEVAWKGAERHGWYSANGHRPIKDWFFKEFQPERFKRNA